MPVIDGQAVSAAITNPAFLDGQDDDVALGKIGFHNTDVISGYFVDNIQRAFNKAADTLGLDTSGNATAEADTTNKDYASNTVISNGQNHKVAIGLLDGRFHGTTGHTHDGTDGEGAFVSAQNLSNVALKGFFIQQTSLASVSGGSVVVTTEMTGKSPSTTSTTTGVVTVAPYNRVILRNDSGSSAADPFSDTSGNEVYGRITESGGAWTLTFYVLDGVTETAYSFPDPVDIRWWAQELYNPVLFSAPVYSELAYLIPGGQNILRPKQETPVEVPDGVIDSFTLTEDPVSADALDVYVDDTIATIDTWDLVRTPTTQYVQFKPGFIPEAARTVYFSYWATPITGAPSGAGDYDVVYGTEASPFPISAAGGITPTAFKRQLWFVQSDGGAITISANPQIAAGSMIGQKVTLMGASAVNTITITNGFGVTSNGAVTLVDDNAITYIWTGTVWRELART